MARNIELKALLSVLSLIGLGCFLFYAGHLDRETPALINTPGGVMDLSPYFQASFPNAFYGPLFMALFLSVHCYVRLKLPQADPFVLPAVALLSGMGLILTLRLAPDLAIHRNEALVSLLNRHPRAVVTDNVRTLAGLGLKQFIFILLGMLGLIACLFLFTRRTFAWLASKKYFWVMISAALILITLLFGKTINQRSLWLFGFQTVELVKLLMLFFIAGYVYERGKGLMTYQQDGFKTWLTYAGPFLIMWFFALIPLVLQRDLGPTFLIFVVFLVMFYLAGNRLSVTLLFVLLITAVGYGSYKTGFPAIARERILMMMNPFGYSESLTRSLWAIASGGLLGQGIGYGRPYMIPEVQSDFIFSALCEEMGFAGAMIVILAYAVLLVRIFRIAARTSHLYQKTLLVGIGALMGLEAGVIMLGNMGIIPMTGITLPLVSYGGSSLLVHFLMIGIVLKISGENHGDQED